MRINIAGTLILLVINILVDIYITRAIKRRTQRRWIMTAFRAVCLTSGVLFTLLVALPLTRITDDMFVLFSWLLLIFVALLVPRYLFAIVDLVSKTPLLWHHPRWKVVSIAACVVAAISFVMIAWGALVTRYSIQIKEVTVHIDNLPNEFEGYRIVQISDMHVGSYGNSDNFISELSEKVNSLDADLVVFTGDIVNRHSNEIRPFIHALSQFRGHDGQLAVLGNHDYADYYYPEDARARDNDRARLINFYSMTAFDLILDDFRTIYRGNDSIIVIGVENIGHAPFPVYGNLESAYSQLDDDNVKILLSHDPYHWHNDIANKNDKNIALTLSGHTHAMQTRLLGWSPAALFYPEWSGLYADDDDSHKLYVNVGIGTVGLPMRIGATPEITLITLTNS